MKPLQQSRSDSIVVSSFTRFLVLASASGLLIWHSRSAPWVSGSGLLLLIPALWASAAFPKHRQQMLSGVAFVLLVLLLLKKEAGLNSHQFADWLPDSRDVLRVFLFVVVMIAISFALFVVARDLNSRPAGVAKFSVPLLHVAIWLVALITSSWTALELFPLMVWRLSYLMRSASLGSIKATKFSDHFFTLLPPFGSIYTPTPIGKGWTYLSQYDTYGDSIELMKCQADGVKLLFLAGAWELALLLMDGAVYGDRENIISHVFAGASFQQTRLHVLLTEKATYAPVAVSSLYLELLYTSLRIAAFGHVVVGSIKLFGFNVPKHVDKPLLSKSIVEFWGRWTFYYKELVNEFFFLPAFVYLSDAGMRLRLLIAVFAAVLFGNLYFWVLWQFPRAINTDWQTLINQMECVAVYFLFLATGVYISMIRQRRIRRDSSKVAPWAAARSIFGVVTFYSVIHVWNIADSGLGPIERLLWFVRLAGLG